jgi:hypothetical protein
LLRGRLRNNQHYLAKILSKRLLENTHMGLGEEEAVDIHSHLGEEVGHSADFWRNLAVSLKIGEP